MKLRKEKDRNEAEEVIRNAENVEENDNVFSFRNLPFDMKKTHSSLVSPAAVVIDNDITSNNPQLGLLKKTLEPLKREKDKYSMLALETKINKK